jgi:serine/threonine-protein kinase RsbT
MSSTVRSGTGLSAPSQRQLRTPEDIVGLRQAVRQVAVEFGFSLVDQTKLVTAASELARNAIEHGGGGIATIAPLVDGVRRGVKLVFTDEGPGIPDIDKAMTDGFSTGGGLGLGLGGARRLSNDFSIVSGPGRGTSVTIVRWK